MFNANWILIDRKNTNKNCVCMKEMIIMITKHESWNREYDRVKVKKRRNNREFNCSIVLVL